MSFTFEACSFLHGWPFRVFPQQEVLWSFHTSFQFWLCLFINLGSLNGNSSSACPEIKDGWEALLSTGAIRKENKVQNKEESTKFGKLCVTDKNLLSTLNSSGGLYECYVRFEIFTKISIHKTFTKIERKTFSKHPWRNMRTSHLFTTHKI